MSQLRLNLLNGRWVTVAAERASRPADFAPRHLPVETGPGRPCPFCPGNEEATPPALETRARLRLARARGPQPVPGLCGHGAAHLFAAQAPPADLVAVGRAVRDALTGLAGLIGDVAYNLVFHTAPHNDDRAFHWHVHMVARVTSSAGFEQGTGVLINIVAPERATEQLRRSLPAKASGARGPSVAAHGPDRRGERELRRRPRDPDSERDRSQGGPR